MGWCDDIKSKYYNKLINVKQNAGMKNSIEKIINMTI